MKSPAPFAGFEEKQLIDQIEHHIKQTNTTMTAEEKYIEQEVKELEQVIRESNSALFNRKSTYDLMNLFNTLTQDLNNDALSKLKEYDSNCAKLESQINTNRKQVPLIEKELQETQKLLNVYKEIFQMNIYQISEIKYIIMFNKQQNGKTKGIPLELDLTEITQKLRDQFWQTYKDIFSNQQ